MSEIRVDTISEKTSANGVAVDGVTLKDGQVDLADSKKILLGTGDDLQLSHDGTDSIINNATGTLKVQADSVRFQNAAGNETIFGGTADGAAFLVFNDATKIATTNTGVDITGGFAATSASTISVTDNSDNLTLTSTDADANVGPNLRLYRNSSSPADSDSLGIIDFEGRNDNSQDVVYGQIETLTTDVSDGTEDGYMNLSVMLAGTLRSRIEMDSSETVINEASQDLNFRVESNGNANMLFVNGGTDKVGVGIADPTGTFHVKTDNAGTTMYIEDSHAGNGDGPELYLYRNSSSPADADDIGIIKFLGKNDAGQDAIYGQIKSIILDASDGTEDGKIEFYHMLNGSLAPSLQLTSSEVVINESSNDVDFRVESNGSTHALFVDAGNNQIHYKNSAQLTHKYFTNDTHSLQFIDLDGDSLQGKMDVGHSDGTFQFYTGAVTNNARFIIDSAGNIATGNEFAGDVSAGGLCLNQGGNDTNAFSLKSSDVAHGVTDLEETDTWFSLRKFGANDGGVQLRSMSGASSNCGLFIDSVAGSEDTGKGTGDHGCTNIDAQKDNGTDKAPLASNGNLLTVSNDGAVRFILDAEGDIHVDGSSSISTYDTYEDAQLVRAYDLSYGQTSKGLINSKFDKFVNYNHDSLVEAGIIGVPDKKENEDGTESYGLLNSTAMQRLHNGAIWQQYEKHQKLASAFYKLAEKTIGKEEADKLLTEEEIQLLN